MRTEKYCGIVCLPTHNNIIQKITAKRFVIIFSVQALIL